MSIEEMARFFATDKHPDLPHAPCYICKYADGLCCTNETECTVEHQASVYKEWLEREVVQ
jgi:hypothetical protein